MVNTNAPSVSWREAWPKPLGMLSRDEHGFFVTYGVVTTWPQSHVCCQGAYRPFLGRCSWHPKPRLSLRTVIPARACWPGSRTAFHRARSCA